MHSYANAIKNRVTMLAVAQRYGMAVNAKGYAACPFHEERTPSLRIYSGTGGWHCFGCGDGGSVIDFVMRYFEISYRQAVVRLDMDFALGLPLTAKPDAQMMQAAETVKRERNAAAREREQAEAEYWQAFDRYRLLDAWALNYRPKGPEEPIDLRYMVALHLLPEVRDNYERAEERRRGLHADLLPRGRYQTMEQGRLSQNSRAV